MREPQGSHVRTRVHSSVEEQELTWETKALKLECLFCVFFWFVCFFFVVVLGVFFFIFIFYRYWVTALLGY